jgi:hypothetical protein
VVPAIHQPKRHDLHSVGSGVSSTRLAGRLSVSRVEGKLPSQLNRGRSEVMGAHENDDLNIGAPRGWLYCATLGLSTGPAQELSLTRMQKTLSKQSDDSRWRLEFSIREVQRSFVRLAWLNRHFKAAGKVSWFAQLSRVATSGGGRLVYMEFSGSGLMLLRRRCGFHTGSVRPG